MVADDGGDSHDAELILCSEISPESLLGLDGFDYVWLITDFNRNRQGPIPLFQPASRDSSGCATGQANEAVNLLLRVLNCRQLGINNYGGHWKPTVRPPPSLKFDGSKERSGGSKASQGSIHHWAAPVIGPVQSRSGARSRRAAVRVGILATRSPDHPNKLGLSAARIISVDCKAGVVRMRGVDLLDGTPVLDIKPYLAYADAFPEARQGWTVYPDPAPKPRENTAGTKDESSAPGTKENDSGYIPQ